MIKYALKCKPHDHVFEAWFSRSADYDEQAKKGLVECPDCGSTKISKAPMAPNVKRSSKNKPNFTELAERIRSDIESNCDDVGEKFSDEARAIHYGEKPERGIYGTASPREAKDLIDEGINVAPLPDSLAPKPKKKLN